jgi:hypothetical protein
MREGIGDREMEAERVSGQQHRRVGGVRKVICCSEDHCEAARSDSPLELDAILFAKGCGGMQG